MRASKRDLAKSAAAWLSRSKYLKANLFDAHETRPATWDLSDKSIGGHLGLIALVFRTWFNRPSDTVRPTRSPRTNRGRHRLREVVMTQTLRETSSIEVGCDRAFAGVIGSSPAWQGVLVAGFRVATTEGHV